MPRVLAVLRTQKLNRQGKAPIYLRIADTDRTLYRSIGVLVRPSEWNERAGRVRKGHPRADEINTLIQARIAAAEGHALKIKTAGDAPTAHAIRDALTPARHKDFVAYALAVSREHHDARGSIGRGQKIRAVMGKFQAFLSSEGMGEALPFDRLTQALLRRFETYLLTVKGNHPNTARDGIMVLRAVFFRAIDDGQVDPAHNPFFRFKMTKEQPTDRAKLSLDDLNAIKALDLPKGSLLWRARAYFMFSLYLGGIRIGDLLFLRRDHVKEGAEGVARLEYRTRKTGVLRSVQLPPQAREILEAFPPRAGSPYLFPLLDDCDVSTPAKEHNAISKKTALVNKYLAKIGALAGLSVKLSTHIARHTFADRARAEGVGSYDVSKTLTHGNLKTTEAYLSRFDNAAVDATIERMSKVFGGDQ